MIAVAIVLLALIGLVLVWALTERAAIKATYAGRRDQAAGNLDTTRTDLDYVHGAADEYLRSRGGAR